MIYNLDSPLVAPQLSSLDTNATAVEPELEFKLKLRSSSRLVERMQDRETGLIGTRVGKRLKEGVVCGCMCK